MITFEIATAYAVPAPLNSARGLIYLDETVSKCLNLLIFPFRSLRCAYEHAAKPGCQ
jgi:hypothetical protein